MGSDWTWDLQVPVAAEPALRELYALAAERNLRPRRPDGLINLFGNPATSLRTVTDTELALAALATGREHGQLWTDGTVDVFLSWEDGTLRWSLDAVFCCRLPTPSADTFRELHARLTSLWLAAAQRLDASLGRVYDEWSSDQVWHLCGPDGEHPPGAWPVELGWWAYLGPGKSLSPPPLPDMAAQTRRLRNGAQLMTLLNDPAAVEPLRYEDIHTRWLLR